MREFVNCLLSDTLDQAIEATDLGQKPKICFILEEVQNLIPSGSLRSTKNQEISRFVTQGRNFGLSYIALTQRLASVDTNLVEISGLKFFAKTEGENSLRKIKAWLPKDVTRKLRDLTVGQFYKQHGSTVELVTTKKFYTATKPRLYQHHEPRVTYSPLVTRPPPKPSKLERLFKILGV